MLAIPPNAAPISLAIFDIAGTTVNEHGMIYRALRESIEAAHASVADADLMAWMGADKVEAITALLEQGSMTATPELVSSCYERFCQLLQAYYATTPPKPLPGVEEAIYELRARGIKVALTTGFSVDVAAPLLSNLGWQVIPGGADRTFPTAPFVPRADTPAATLFDAVVCSSEVAAARPLPYMIHRAMERTTTASVEQVLIAGDTRADVEAGHNAGVRHCVGVLTGRLDAAGFRSTPANAVVGSVADIPAYLDRLAS